MVNIIIFAMIAAFLAFRLWAVLGKRTGHEQALPPQPVDEAPRVPLPGNQPADPLEAPPPAEAAAEPDAQAGLRAIMQADRRFEPAEFVAGARQAYELILTAFWKGEEEGFRDLVSDEVREAFAAAIAERKAQGHVLDNRLVGIERATIAQARMNGTTAEVSVRFDADIAAVTRNEAGEVVAGSLSDAVATHDCWTFARDTRLSDPNWILVDTDDETA